MKKARERERETKRTRPSWLHKGAREKWIYTLAREYKCDKSPDGRGGRKEGKKERKKEVSTLLETRALDRLIKGAAKEGREREAGLSFFTRHEHLVSATRPLSALRL